MEPGLLKSADWPILIDLYFFFGGLAGGAFVIATLASLFDGRRSRDVVRIGYYVAFLAVLPCPILLIVDLGTPSRFLNMLMVSKPTLAIGQTVWALGPFHFKPYSPMSAGAWGLMLFSACAFVCAAETWLADRRNRPMPLVRTLAGLAGAGAGFFLAAYPGVLLGATARPLFIGAHWLGALFLAVGAATGGAAIALVLARLVGEAGVVRRVMRATSLALVVQLVALALIVISVATTGSAGLNAALMRLVAGSHALAFWAAVSIGIAAPLLLQRGLIGARLANPAAVYAMLVLAGGFLVKYVLLAAGQASTGGAG